MTSAVDTNEMAAAVLAPFFDAVRDEYVAFAPTSGQPLARLRKVKFVIDPAIRDTVRHFAACRDDGVQMIFAPEIVDLPIENLVAILAHEFGHAADFAYPGAWSWPADGPGTSVFVGSDNKTRALAWRELKRSWGQSTPVDREPLESEAVAWMRAWEKRNRDQVEWTADAIAMTVTGHKLGYCGACMMQTFDRCVSRPMGLR